MDFSVIVLLMVIMAILDMIGRMVRKRAGGAQMPNGDPVDGADVLKYVTGDDPRESPETRGSVRAERDQGGLAVPQRVEMAGPPPVERLSAAEGFPAVKRPPAAEGLPAATPPVPVSGPRVPELRDRTLEEIELRDRAPRELVLRSRDPRPVERQPSARVAGTSDSVPATLRAPGESTIRRVPPKPPAPRTPSRSPGRRHSTGVVDRLGLDSAAGLRRVIVAREVLGPPVALRNE